MNDNYMSRDGAFVFFQSANPPPPPPAGWGVWRRPKDARWAGVPQIIGDYCEQPLNELYAELAGERENVH